KIWAIIKKSIGGFLGVTGFLLSLILVPIYLFFLLKQRPAIQRRWKEYLPLRNSPLKNEVADVLLQINSYIIAYFRGQLLVCLVVQNLEGLFYAPRIVGNSVGLHPMTVIVSIFVWGLLIGGLLGPILAVPLTATIKVLLARYVWGERLREQAIEAIEEVPVV